MGHAAVEIVEASNTCRQEGASTTLVIMALQQGQGSGFLPAIAGRYEGHRLYLTIYPKHSCHAVHHMRVHLGIVPCGTVEQHAIKT